MTIIWLLQFFWSISNIPVCSILFSINSMCLWHVLEIKDLFNICYDFCPHPRPVTTCLLIILTCKFHHMSCQLTIYPYVFYLSCFSCFNYQIFLDKIANARHTRRNTIFWKLVGEKWPYPGCPCHICTEVHMYGFALDSAREQSRLPTREGSGVRISGNTPG